MNTTKSPKVKTLTIAEGKVLLSGLPNAPEGLRYVCIGANCWGSGATAEAAAKRAREEGWRGEFVLHLVNEGFEVDSINGSLYYNKATPGTRINIARFRQS